MKALASFIMRGRMQALLAAVATATVMWLFPPFTTVLGELALGGVIALVTLRNGAREGALVLAGTAIVAAVLAIAAVQQGEFAAAMTAVVVLPIVPVWVLAAVLRQTISWGATLTVAAIVGAVMVLAMYAATGGDPTTFWHGQLSMMLDNVRQAVTSASGQAQIPPADMEMALTGLAQGFDALAPWMNGLFAVSMLTMFVASLILARWWQAQLYNPGGWGSEFYSLRLPKTLAIASGVLIPAAVVLPGVVGQIAGDCLFVATAVYLFPGLSIVHGWVRGKPYAGPVLTGVYVLMLIIPHVSVLLAGVGWLDAWVNVRRRESA